MPFDKWLFIYICIKGSTMCLEIAFTTFKDISSYNQAIC